MRQDVRQPARNKEIQLFVARSGPARGKPECEAAFLDKAGAVEFLTSQHGLDPEEAKKLAKSLHLPLKPRWHGAEQCEIEKVSMPPARAKKALSGELYLARVRESELPTPKTISMKVTLKIKLREPKKPKRSSRSGAKPASAKPKISKKPR